MRRSTTFNTRCTSTSENGRNSYRFAERLERDEEGPYIANLRPEHLSVPFTWNLFDSSERVHRLGAGRAKSRGDLRGSLISPRRRPSRCAAPQTGLAAFGLGGTRLFPTLPTGRASKSEGRGDTVSPGYTSSPRRSHVHSARS